MPCSGAGRSRPASSHRIGRRLTRAPAAAPAPAAVASAAPSSAATSPISRPATVPQTQGTLAGHATKTSEAGTGFLPLTGRRARAGRTLSSSSNRSFVFATPETPGWKGGIGLPKALHAIWSPVSLFTTCVVPTTWFTQMTGCCRRPLFGDLRKRPTPVKLGVGWTGETGAHIAAAQASNRSLAGGKTRDVIGEKCKQSNAHSGVCHGTAGAGTAVGHGGRRDRRCASPLSHSRADLSQDSALARAEVTCTQFGSDLKRRGVGSSSLPLGPDYDIH